MDRRRHQPGLRQTVARALLAAALAASGIACATNQPAPTADRTRTSQSSYHMHRYKLARGHGCDVPERTVERAKSERDDAVALRKLGDMAIKCPDRKPFQAPMKEVIDGRARALAEDPERPLAAVRIAVDIPMRISVFWASVSVDGRLAPVRPAAAGRHVVVAEVDLADTERDYRHVIELRRQVELEFPARRVDIVVRVAASDGGDPTLHVELAPPRAWDAAAPRARPIMNTIVKAPLELGMDGMFFEGRGDLCLDGRARPETLLLTAPVHPRIVGYMIDSARSWKYQAPTVPEERPCMALKVGTSAR